VVDFPFPPGTREWMPRIGNCAYIYIYIYDSGLFGRSNVWLGMDIYQRYISLCIGNNIVRRIALRPLQMMMMMMTRWARRERKLKECGPSERQMCRHVYTHG
jgi:hypothetical protein